MPGDSVALFEGKNTTHLFEETVGADYELSGEAKRLIIAKPQWEPGTYSTRKLILLTARDAVTEEPIPSAVPMTYKINGEGPYEYSPSGFYINETCTVETQVGRPVAIEGYDGGTRTYNYVIEAIEAPTFSPAGTYQPTLPITVSLSTTTPDAEMYYKTSWGADWTLYEGPFELNSYNTITAKTVKGGSESYETQMTYFALMAPVVEPASAEDGESPLTVTITNPNDTGDIKYQKASDEQYLDYTGPITLNDSDIIRTYIIGENQSDTVNCTYMLDGKSLRPTVYGEDYFAESTIVSIYGSAYRPAGQTFYYTIDGTDPVTNGILYTVPITLTDTTTIKAITREAGLEPSTVVEKTFHKGTVQVTIDSGILTDIVTGEEIEGEPAFQLFLGYQYQGSITLPTTVEVTQDNGNYVIVYLAGHHETFYFDTSESDVAIAGPMHRTISIEGTPGQGTYSEPVNVALSFEDDVTGEAITSGITGTYSINLGERHQFNYGDTIAITETGTNNLQFDLGTVPENYSPASSYVGEYIIQ